MKISFKKSSILGCFSWALLLPVLVCPLLATEDALPQKPAPDMLSSVWKNSPYQRGIASDAPASQYALTGIFTIGSQDFVSVLNKTTSDRFTLSKTPDKNNSKLLDIHFSNSLKEAFANVEIEGTQYKIKYDPTLLAETPTLPATTNSATPTNAGKGFTPPNMPPWMTNGGVPPRFFRRQRTIDNPNPE